MIILLASKCATDPSARVAHRWQYARVLEGCPPDVAPKPGANGMPVIIWSYRSRDQSGWDGCEFDWWEFIEQRHYNRQALAIATGWGRSHHLATNDTVGLVSIQLSLRKMKVDILIFSFFLHFSCLSCFLRCRIPHFSTRTEV